MRENHAWELQGGKSYCISLHCTHTSQTSWINPLQTTCLIRLFSQPNKLI